MPFRRGYDKEREDDETKVLLDQESIRLESLHYKKTEDNDSRKIRMPPDQTIECEIQPSDNLATFSLKYRVSRQYRNTLKFEYLIFGQSYEQFDPISGKVR